MFSGAELSAPPRVRRMACCDTLKCPRRLDSRVARGSEIECAMLRQRG